MEEAIRGDDHDHDHDQSILDLSTVSLRPFDLSDVDDFVSWAGDEKVCRFASWKPGMSREEGLELVKYKIFGHPWSRSICLGDKSIGDVSVTPCSGEDRCRAEIGYVVGSAYWGKGVATLVVRLVANAIFWEWPHLERLEALVDVQNVASQRVLEKAGFEKEGVLKKYLIVKGMTRDMVMYSFLNSSN